MQCVWIMRWVEREDWRSTRRRCCFLAYSHLGWQKCIASGSSRRRGTGGEGDFMPGICSEKLPGIYSFHPTFGSWNLKLPKFAVHRKHGNFPGLIFTLWKIFKGNVSQSLGRGDWDPNLNTSQGGSRTSFRSRHLGKPKNKTEAVLGEGKGWISEEGRWGKFLKEHTGIFVFGGEGVLLKKTPLVEITTFFLGGDFFPQKWHVSLAVWLRLPAFWRS